VENAGPGSGGSEFYHLRLCFDEPTDGDSIKDSLLINLWDGAENPQAFLEVEYEYIPNR